LDSKLESFERRFEMNAIGNALSKSCLVVIGLVAVAVPVSAQSQKVSFSVLPPSPTIALLDVVSHNVPVDTVAPEAPVVIPTESLATATKFALTPAIKPWDKLTADEKEAFGRQMNASTLRWNIPAATEPAKSSGKSVVFLNRGLQPGQH
jgi:hypothetical protein